MIDLSGMEIAFLVFASIVYFAPTIMAVDKKHPSLVAVFIVNLLLGWTIVGWVVALIWTTGASVKVISPQDTQSDYTGYTGSTITEDLQRLSALRKQGVLTEEEFTRAKDKLLDKTA